MPDAVPLTLTEAQKKHLLKSGVLTPTGAIDWQAVLALVGKYGSLFVNLVIALIGDLKPAPKADLQGMVDDCPCPDGKDGHACCHCCQRQILLAALCCECHCSEKECDCKKCCQETLGHLLKAVECCTAHLCC
jgi:hypothetical protein